MNMSLSKVQKMVMDKEAWHAAIHGVSKVRHDWETELNWTEEKNVQVRSTILVNPLGVIDHIYVNSRTLLHSSDH